LAEHSEEIPASTKQLKIMQQKGRLMRKRNNNIEIT